VILSSILLSIPLRFLFHPQSRPPPTPTLFPYTTLFRSWTSSSRFARRGRALGQPMLASGRASVLVSTTLIGALRDCPGCAPGHRSEEHTSELQSRFDLVCRLLLEKKKKNMLYSRRCTTS